MTIYTQDMLDALKTAYASGRLSTSYNGNTVTYHSLAELERAMARIQGELDAAAGTPRPRQVRINTRRGI